MKQIIEGLKKQYDALKSNAAKLNLAKKFSFNSRKEFEEYLELQEENKKTSTIHNVYILDRSASMSSKIKAAVEGIEQDIKSLVSDTVKFKIGLVGFSDYNKITKELWEEKPTSKKIKENTISSTALYDAIGFTIEEIKSIKKPEDKVLLKIFTDGQENDSRKHNKESISKQIEELNSTGEWTITFVGTDNDVKNVVNTLNIRGSNTLVHNNTSEGVKLAFTETVYATKQYIDKVEKGIKVLDGFYKKQGEL